MAMRFRKSFGKGPFRVTVSKSGVSTSVGGKGFRVTKKAGGGVRTTTSIPGTGISYTQDYSKKRATKATSAKTAVSAPAARTAPAEIVKDVKPKNTLTELLLCFFLGIFGAHRFYTRKWGTAILYLLTFGIFYIGWIVDFVLILIRFLKERKTVAPSDELSIDGCSDEIPASLDAGQDFEI